MPSRPAVLSSAAQRLLSITACAWELRRCHRAKPAGTSGTVRPLGVAHAGGARP